MIKMTKQFISENDIPLKILCCSADICGSDLYFRLESIFSPNSVLRRNSGLMTENREKIRCRWIPLSTSCGLESLAATLSEGSSEKIYLLVKDSRGGYTRFVLYEGSSAEIVSAAEEMLKAVSFQPFCICTHECERLILFRRQYAAAILSTESSPDIVIREEYHGGDR